MQSEGNRCAALLSLLMLLTLERAPGASPAVIIAECSVPNVTFSLTQTLDMNSEYSFLAACMSNGSCVDGKVTLGKAVKPTVGSTFQVSMGPSCTLSDELSPSEPGVCTLLISSSNAFHETPGTFSTVCTLTTLSSGVSSTSMQTTESEQPPPSTDTPDTTAAILSVLSSTSMQTTESEQPPPSTDTPNTTAAILSVVSSTSMQTTGGIGQLSSSIVNPNANGTVAPASALSTPVLVIIIVVPLCLLIMVLIMAIASLLMWMRHSKIRSRHTQKESVNMLSDTSSGNVAIVFNPK